jgi:molybdate transport system substrate-binding protein
MWKAVQGGWASRPQIFARNSMAIATPRGNPAGVRSIQDLASTRVLTAICAPTVPCGSLTNRLFEKNNVEVAAITKELDVRAVLGKVISDQVDAGIVYATDVRALSTEVTAIPIPTSQNVATSYPIAVVTDSNKRVAARTFINFVRNPDSGVLILKEWGFTAP